jgi:chromosome condensin MukBEF MukE localization factor
MVLPGEVIPGYRLVGIGSRIEQHPDSLGSIQFCGVVKRRLAIDVFFFGVNVRAGRDVLFR